MKIYSPFKSRYNPSQDFGESRACVDLRTGRIIGKRTLVCPAGTVDFYKSVGLLSHNGQDIPIYHGEPIYFPVSAETTWTAYTEVDGAGGLGVDVFSDTPVLLKDGRREYVKFRFWHLKSFNVYDGQKVSMGTMIARGDSTGASSADHLHWSVKICDKDRNTLNKDNGWAGAIPFEGVGKMKTDTFVLDELQVYIGQIARLKDMLAQLLNKMILNLQAQVNALT